MLLQVKQRFEADRRLIAVRAILSIACYDKGGVSFSGKTRKRTLISVASLGTTRLHTSAKFDWRISQTRGGPNSSFRWSSVLFSGKRNEFQIDRVQLQEILIKVRAFCTWCTPTGQLQSRGSAERNNSVCICMCMYMNIL